MLDFRGGIVFGNGIEASVFFKGRDVEAAQ